VKKHLSLSACLAAIAAVIALLLPAAAKATPYWFFQGYLSSIGTQQVFLANQCCNNTNYDRVSWEFGSGHPERTLYIRRSDSGWSFDSWTDYDHEVQYSTITYVKGGCQNPDSYPPTWTNCHVGNGP
jgi:hypothetical protein